MNSLQLLHQRLTEASASLAQAQGPLQLAQTISHNAGNTLALEDHPWLRAAVTHFPDDPPKEIIFLSDPGQLTRELLDTAVTIGLGAIPETGSVLLGGTSPQAFRLSLCPHRHIIVIPAHQASLTLAQALAITAREPSGLVSWITGPSRTADIEKVLVLGAQGASELTVILYQEE
jgi:L-lactate dehydrogenase complex protein LldG